MLFLRLIVSALAEGFAGTLRVVTIETEQAGEPTRLCCRSHGDIVRFIHANGFGPIRGVAAEEMSGGRIWTEAEDFLEHRVRHGIERALGTEFSEAKWTGLKEEMANAVINEAHALDGQRTLYDSLSPMLSGQGHKSLFAYLAQAPATPRDIAGIRHDAASLLMQIGSFAGHRTHPCAKTRMLPEAGTGPRRRPIACAEFDAYAPEAAPNVALPVLAVRKDRVTASLGQRVGAAGMDYCAFFAASFPEAWRRWQTAMTDLGGKGAPAAFAPIPVHPLQLDVIRAHFAGAIAAGDILFPAKAVIVQRPTVSLRTLMPVARPEEPQIKTTLAMQMTNDVRTISPSRVFNGPVLSDLLSEVAASDPALGACFRLLAEPAAIAWGRDTDPASEDYGDGFHLGAILRANPASVVSPGEIAIPLCALLSQSPAGEAILIAEIMREAGASGPEEARAWFAGYVDVVLGATMGLLLGYGIGLEAHQQNADMVFTANGTPIALVYRDVSDIDIYEPMLLAAGFHARPSLHPFIRNLWDDIERPLRQTTHSTFVSHLFPVAGVIADAFALPARPFLAIIRERVAAAIARERRCREEAGGEAAAHLEALAIVERRILGEPIRTKCLLRTRAAQSQEVAFTAIENPLADA